MSQELGLLSKKTFFKRQTLTKRVKGFGSFLYFFPFILGKFIALKVQSTASSICRILTLLKYFTYVNLCWCWNICSFHFISYNSRARSLRSKPSLLIYLFFFSKNERQIKKLKQKPGERHPAEHFHSCFSWKWLFFDRKHHSR